ncbi:cupredoxin domain-containing protein [Terracidiphilus gabretensis]|jgi:cytochrome c oxidase subunit II|uniref:cupredoxin domain-containing protein n=1 Tax=Terracidiphilus gabretensis TaxID=1577687 RepID=UPI001E3A7FBA|nr:cupredoxin domain-containing protein [Terracidiphilus gabretensis]
MMHLKRTLALITVLSGLVIVKGFGLHASGASVDPHRVVIVAKRYSFDPGTVTLKKGEPVDLVLQSSDVPHGVRFRELNVEVKAAKGGQGEVQFTPDKTGDFVGHCSVFCGAGHGSMSITLHVVD